MSDVKTNIFKSGIVNNPKDPELVPRGGASDSLGWITRGGFIELSRGKMLVGQEGTVNGSVKGHHFGYTTDGDAIQFRKVNTRIQFYNEQTDRLRDKYALNFDGNDYVSIPSAAVFNDLGKPLSGGGMSYSISFWLKTTTKADQSPSEKWPGGAYPWAIRGPGTGSGHITFAVYDGVSVGVIVAATDKDYADGQWHHIICVRDLSVAKMYIYADGVLISQISDTLAATDVSNTGVWSIGARTPSAASFNFTGSLDDFRVYSKALSASEVLDLYNGVAISSSNLIGHWKFDEGSGATATDSSTSAQNGTITGAAYTTDRPAYNYATWVDVINDLTDDEQYTFANHQSLSGSFTYASGYDGLYKINLANPADYKILTSETKNFLHPGKILISDSRMFMWDLPHDRTGLYLSYIDAQNYTTLLQETLTTGAGSTAVTGSLAVPAGNTSINGFAVVIAAPIAAVKNISAITQAANGLVTTSAAHGLSAGDYVVFDSILGMTQLNQRIARVMTTPLSTTFTIDIDTTGFTAYSSGGTVGKSERFTDNNDGTLTGNLGGTGTVNYMTGAVSLTFSSSVVSGQPVVAEYQYENSTNHGLADFTYSATRLAGEGDVFRQDEGGDAILSVEGFDGLFFSLKERSAYELNLTADDTNATNKVYRRGIGIPYFRASVSTGSGIIFMDTANPDYPKLTRLEKNITGDGYLPIELAPHFDFSLYEWDQCAMNAVGEYILFSGRTESSPTNNRLFVYSLRWQSVDVLPFSAATIQKDAGLVYIGDTITDTVYNLFSGFDDDGFDIENEWISGADLLDTEELKREKRLTLEGEIMREQDIEVYISLDNDDFELLGTIEGIGSYVDVENSHTIGSQALGMDEIGGGGSGVDVYPYFVEFKINTGKFYRRRLKFKTTGLGYASVSMIKDKDILGYGDKIPHKYRTN